MRLKLLSLFALGLSGFIAGCDNSSAEAPTAPANTTPTVITTTPVAGVYVAGKVVDPTTGSPVAGVRVGMKKSRLYTHTDKNGNYIISSTNVIAARAAGRVSASDSTQTYVDTTHKAVSDTTVAATVTDSVQVKADTTTLASTEVYSKVDSTVPQFTVVQRNFGGNFQPYAPAGVKVWLEVYKNDSAKTPVTIQKLGLMTAMASGTIPGYSGFVYFKYAKNETYDFTVRVMVWNKDSSAITTGSDYMSCESNVGDITFPTLNGSGYIVPSQFLIQQNDTASVDSGFTIKLAQVGWNGINWHIDTGATLKYTYKFPSAYAPAAVSIGKWGLLDYWNYSPAYVVQSFVFGDTSDIKVGWTRMGAGFQLYAPYRDSLLRYTNGAVSWYVSSKSLPTIGNTTQSKVLAALDSTFKLTVTKDSLNSWGKMMSAKGVTAHLWDSAYKSGLYVWRDTVYCGKGGYAVRTKDSAVMVESGYSHTEKVYTPVYEFFTLSQFSVTAWDSVTVSGPAPRWMLSDTQGVFSVPVTAELKSKLKAAEDLLASQITMYKDSAAYDGAYGNSLVSRKTTSWSSSQGWAGVKIYAPQASFTLSTKFVNHLGTVIGDVGTAKVLLKP